MVLRSWPRRNTERLEPICGPQGCPGVAQQGKGNVAAATGLENRHSCSPSTGPALGYGESVWGHDTRWGQFQLHSLGGSTLSVSHAPTPATPLSFRPGNEGGRGSGQISKGAQHTRCLLGSPDNPCEYGALPLTFPFLNPGRDSCDESTWHGLVGSPFGMIWGRPV